uniref:6-phosphofructokinase n=1 Tax=Tetraselmis sp. GSL018 TaxID=582737 RepID=A0A061RRW2_9CHLO
MGRQSGFIAMSASLASGVVDVCLIPEVPFKIEKLAAHLQDIIHEKGHAVICVAEGAGQELMQEFSDQTDASGNPILQDIGVYLKTQLKERLDEPDVKYIDPTYMIRAIPTTSQDRIYCKALGQSAVHGAFAGYTDITVGMVNTHMAILPIPTIIMAPKVVNVKGSSYNRLRSALRQPDLS